MLMYELITNLRKVILDFMKYGGIKNNYGLLYCLYFWTLKFLRELFTINWNLYNFPA